MEQRFDTPNIVLQGRKVTTTELDATELVTIVRRDSTGKITGIETGRMDWRTWEESIQGLDGRVLTLNPQDNLILEGFDTELDLK